MQEGFLEVMDELEEQKEKTKFLMDQLGKKSQEFKELKRAHAAEIKKWKKKSDQAYALVTSVKKDLAAYENREK